MCGHKKNGLHDKRVTVRDADVVTRFYVGNGKLKSAV